MVSLEMRIDEQEREAVDILVYRYYSMRSAVIVICEHLLNFLTVQLPEMGTIPGLNMLKCISWTASTSSGHTMVRRAECLF